VRVAFTDTQSPKIIAHWVMKQTDANGVNSVVENLNISDNCATYGNVTMVGTQALFNGGYVDCALPDFQAKVDDLADRLAECRCLFHEVTPPWVGAQFTVTGTNRIHPLASLGNELHYSAYSDSTTGYTTLAFASGTVIESPQTLLLNQNTLAFTGYNPSAIFPHLELGPTGAHAFLDQPHLRARAMQTDPKAFLTWLSLPLAQAMPAFQANPTLSPTRLYIGGSPTTAHRFIGMLEKLAIDPGCVGNY
jgi:hypothetical protein